MVVDEMGKVNKRKENDDEKNQIGKISNFFKKKEPPSLFTKIGTSKKNLIGDSIKSGNPSCTKFKKIIEPCTTSKLDVDKVQKQKKSPSSVCTDSKDNSKLTDSMNFGHDRSKDSMKNEQTPTKVYKNCVKRLAKPGISPSAKRGLQTSYDVKTASKSKMVSPTDVMSCDDDDILCEILNELHCEGARKNTPNKKVKTPSPIVDFPSASSLTPNKYRECHVRPCDKYSRHIVVDVQRNRDEVILDVKLDGGDEPLRSCVLRGFWCDSHISKGDIVNILSEYKDGQYTVDDKHGLLVVSPDILLSGTSVVSSVFCMRRSVLNEKFKGTDSKNVHMLYGSIIHCLFQKILRNRTYKKEEILSEAKNILKLNKFIHEMYSQNSEENAVLSEIEKYIVPLQTWVQKHTASASSSQRSAELIINDIIDIEENIWSPRFGIKGKIDLTVQVKIPAAGNSQQTKTVPLELKTGRTTYSVEHKGQVTLYSMMCSDRREDPEEGLLLYLKEPAMKMIPAKIENKKGLLQLRNEMAYYISHHVEKEVGQDGHVTYRLGCLPEPINSERACSKCPQLLNCSIYQRCVEKKEYGGKHAMNDLVPETLKHLSSSHLEYFMHWILCMDLEKKEAQNHDLKQLWCSSSTEREATGECVSGLVIQKTDVGQFISSQNYSEGSDCLITFVRHQDYCPVYLDSIGVMKNDLVVISSEDGEMLAISTGVIQNITSACIYVAVDRDTLHTDKSLQSKIFRLDKCNSFNTMGYLFTNLSKLMADDAHSARLRQLIIDKKKPEFNLTLSKKSIEQVKKHFKNMNKPQKTAILKSLMCKDYVLIKGFPGTGKTSTIVALVKILHELGQTILLTSYTHSAVDNILLKLKHDGLPFLRLGRLARIHPSIHDHSSELLTTGITDVADLTNFYSSQSIVATSCLGTNHPIFTQRRFDVCIVDEASQVLQPACLGPIFLSERFILVGDSKQLSPVVQSKEARDLGMDESLFTRLDETGASYKLNLQYRMNRIIMQLGNELVYEGALQCGNDVCSERCLHISNLPELVGDTVWLQQALSNDINLSAVFCDTHLVPAPEICDKKGVIENPTEAHIITQIVETLLQASIKAEDIGVIAPYRSQVKLIHFQLQKVKVQGVEVNTVDQYQGRDKNIILISFVRSISEDSKTSKGQLLNDVKRLNVAVTRAKLKLIMVGDVTTLSRYKPVETIISSMAARNQIIQLPKGVV